MQDKRTTIIENITNTREFKDFVKDYLAWTLDDGNGPMPWMDISLPIHDMIEKATLEVLGEDSDEDVAMDFETELFHGLIEARDTLAGNPEYYRETAKRISETYSFRMRVQEAADRGLSKDTYRGLVDLASKETPPEGVDEEVFVCGLHSVLEDILVEQIGDPRRGPWDYDNAIERIAESLDFGVFYQKTLEWRTEGTTGPKTWLCNDLDITQMISEETLEVLGENIWERDEETAIEFESGLYYALDKFLDDVVEQELEARKKAH